MRRTLNRDRDNDSKMSVAALWAAESATLAFALLFAATSAALAADLIPPPVYAAPIYNWTGFYIGGNIGAGWSGLSSTNFSDTLGSSLTAPTNVQFLGGGQVGANYQFSNGVVIGAEAMFDWLSNSQNAIVTALPPSHPRPLCAASR